MYPLPTVTQRVESWPTEVARFQIAMDQPIGYLTQATTPQQMLLAEKLMTEEIKEMSLGWRRLKDSQSLENITEFVDGAIDTIYVILWTLNTMGVPAEQCFQEVQRSNMAKLWPDGTCHKNEFGKVQKPPGWTPPDLLGILADFKMPATFKNGVRNN